MPFDFTLARQGVTQEQYDTAPRIYVLSATEREVRGPGGTPCDTMGRMIHDPKARTIRAYRAGKDTVECSYDHRDWPCWNLAYEAITGLDFMPSDLNVSECKRNASGLMPSRKTGLAPDTARQWAAMERGPGLASFRAVASDIRADWRDAWAAACNKPFRSLNIGELSDLLYAASWCRAYGKGMADYLSAGFYGVPEKAEQLAFAA